MTPLTDADQLPPVQYLILELLAARIRTGEQVWSFPDRLRPQLRKLAEAGLIGWQSSPAPGACHAWFLDPGRTLMLLDDFQTPVTRLEKALEELHGRLAEARAELARYAERLDRADQLVAQYAPIAVPILADIQARKERAVRMAAHTHYCWTCSDGDKPGDGCHNCRNTGMDQTPCVGCPGPQSVAEPGASAAVRLPHAPCHETDEHQPHPWGDPAHWCDGSGEAGRG